VIHYLRQYCEARNFKVRIFAFTGASASAVYGNTLHGGLKIGINYRRHPPENQVEFAAEGLRGIRLLILEEAYMIGKLKKIQNFLCQLLSTSIIFQFQAPVFLVTWRDVLEQFYSLLTRLGVWWSF